MGVKSLKDQLRDLPAINYNLYMGSGIDVCDNCLEFEVALAQIEAFIKRKLWEQKKNTPKK